MDNILTQLQNTLEERKKETSDNSYVASLYEKGLNEILKKIGEESAEVIIAGKEENKKQIIYEVSDLFFHIMVLLRQQNIDIKDIEEELQRRFGLSGLIEKQNRK
ncbi:Phosphoribosyl-ATP pyrophosphatase [hydrothermal vent metagenome]|uniref:phosphoribosyl-ATP diphosphatase n=1 Tax=hydrothermal vent metagenome TaxID=652676 RepID=A0A1W1CPB5_9ZZZZ